MTTYLPDRMDKVNNVGMSLFGDRLPDILDQIGTRQASFPTTRVPANGCLMAAELVGVVEGELYAFGTQEYSVPLVVLEALEQAPYETIPPAQVFPLFLHGITCTAKGVEGIAHIPRTSQNGETIESWGRPLGVVGVDLNGWDEWLKLRGVFIGHAKYVGLKGVDAWLAHLAFRSWAAHSNAIRTISYHQQDGGDLGAMAAMIPDVVEQPMFKDYAASVALTGGKKRGVGKRSRDVNKQRAIIELASLAGLLRRHNNLPSWDSAFEAACNARPGWVPRDWSDPAGMLKKGIEKLRGTRWEGPHKVFYTK